jgi:hypothetical protein
VPEDFRISITSFTSFLKKFVTFASMIPNFKWYASYINNKIVFKKYVQNVKNKFTSGTKNTIIALIAPKKLNSLKARDTFLNSTFGSLIELHLMPKIHVPTMSVKKQATIFCNHGAILAEYLYYAY